MYVRSIFSITNHLSILFFFLSSCWVNLCLHFSCLFVRVNCRVTILSIFKFIELCKNGHLSLSELVLMRQYDANHSQIHFNIYTIIEYFHYRDQNPFENRIKNPNDHFYFRINYEKMMKKKRRWKRTRRSRKRKSEWHPYENFMRSQTDKNIGCSSSPANNCEVPIKLVTFNRIVIRASLVLVY